MSASAATRAQRRYDELIAKGDKVTYEEVLKMLKSEIISIVIAPTPLIKAENAIEIDNSFDKRRTI
jgi:cytidylate kinase